MNVIQIGWSPMFRYQPLGSGTGTRRQRSTILSDLPKMPASAPEAAFASNGTPRVPTKTGFPSRAN